MPDLVRHDERRKNARSSRRDLRIAFAFEFEREFGAARLDDAAGGEDVNEIGLHIVEQALLVGDQQHRLVGAAHDAVDPVADHAQRVDV